MIQVFDLANTQAKQQFLANFDPRSETWVVSDLRSKLEIQKMLLEKVDGYEDLALLRASEFWKILLKRVRPDLKIISKDFASCWLSDFLEMAHAESGAELLRPRSAPTLISLIDIFAPLFAHPEGSKILTTLFDAEGEKVQQLRIWTDLAFSQFQIFLRKGWILASWIPGILAREEKTPLVWNRPLWIDLGAELRQSEVENFRRLSENAEVRFLIPEGWDQSAFHFLMEPSRLLRQEFLQKKPVVRDRAPRDSLTCYRFSGPLAEVKHVVSEVRKWADHGVPLREIAVISTEVENYWPLLEPALENEGLFSQKSLVARLQSLPPVARFLARLRLRVGRVTFADTEQGVFSSQLELRYEKFRASLRQALGVDDLEAEDALKSFFAMSRAPTQELTVEEVMSWAAQDWTDFERWDLFEILLKEMVTDAASNSKMKTASWISYLECVAGKKEVRVKPGNEQGIAILNLMEAESTHFTHRIFLGLSESQFKKKTSSLVSPHFLNRLGWDYGFFLDHPEQNVLHFEFSWLLQSPVKCDHLVFPATSFSNQPEAPHPIWIRQGGGHQVQIPGRTRLDEVQQSHRPLKPKIARDLGQEPVTSLQVREFPILSATALERYRNCAFQFAAEKWFRLQDPPERDLDLDPRSKGSLNHALFEKLTTEPRRFDQSEAELVEILEEARKNLRLEHRKGIFWQIDRKRALALARRFLEFEKNWRAQFPSVQTSDREARFEFFFHPEDQTFSSQARPGALTLRGSIDRIDQDRAGFLSVVDYKTTWESKRSMGSWLKQNFLQLAIYGWALDRGWVSGHGADKVRVIETMTYQPLNRGKGFVAPEAVGTMAEKVNSKDATLQTKEGLYQELEVLLKELLMRIVNGDITPLPLGAEAGDYSICQDCRWRKLCRAPHLN